MKYVIALDQGTTSSRAIIYDEKLRVIASSQREFTQYFPNPGWVEHDPEEILATQLAVLTEAVVLSQINVSDIVAIGIANQRETTVVWDKQTGRPVCPAIVWQCRRTAGICDDLKARSLGEYIHRTTGLVIDAYFSATKIKWILDNISGAREAAESGRLLFGTVDSWLLWNMTGKKVHATDLTNASRTMLFDINRLCWDEKLCNELSIPASMLPEVLPSASVFGYTGVLGREIPICGIAGDQQAALFGQGCFRRGDVKNTYGTGCFLLMNTGDRACFSSHGLVTTLAATAGDVQYALEGSVFTAGALIKWLRDSLGIIKDASETEPLARSVPDNGGVYIVPAFAGLGSPYWDMYARGAIFGLTRSSGRAHIVRAALEAMAYSTHDLLGAVCADSGLEISSLKIDGGAARNGFLAQFQADILACPIKRPASTETTARGAAMLALIGSGVCSDPDLLDSCADFDVFTPGMAETERRSCLDGWHNAVNAELSRSH